MRLAAGLLVAVAVFAALLAPVASAQDPAATRTVQGQVVNGTADGGDVAGLIVVLHEEGPSRHDHQEVTTEAEGRFRFDVIAFDPETVYGVSVTYSEALYGVDLDLSSEPEPVTITVYEAVYDDGFLTVPSASVLFAQVDKGTQTLWALEIVSISNDTDRAYVPGPEPMQLLRFGLPPGAEGLTVDTRLLQASVIQVERGFGLVASIPPGEHEVMYAYRFPYSGGETVFSRSLRYGADRLRVLAPHEVARLSSAELGAPEDVVIGERGYYLLSGSDLPRGAPIVLRLTDLPTESLADRTKRRLEDAPWGYAAPAALAALMAAVIALALWRRGFAGLPDGRADRETPTTETEYDELVLAIARLDRSFRDGTIDEDAYRRDRAALAARLTRASRAGKPSPRT